MRSLNSNMKSKSLKFKMADPIWWTDNLKITAILMRNRISQFLRSLNFNMKKKCKIQNGGSNMTNWEKRIIKNI